LRDVGLPDQSPVWQNASMLSRFLPGSLALVWIVTAASLHAQEAEVSKADASDAWPQRTMRSSSLWQLPVDASAISDINKMVPSLPPADAAPETWEEHIRACTKLIGNWCRAQGLVLPEGTLFLEDRASGTLVVRSTDGWLQRFTDFTESTRLGKVPRNLTLALDILQSDAATIRGVIVETATQNDHTDALHRLEALVAERRASVVRHLQTESQFNKRVALQAGADMPHADGLILDDAGRAELIRGSQWVGTSLEADSDLAPDMAVIDLNIAFEHHFAPPVQRKALAGQAGKLGAIESSVTDYRRVKVTTAISLKKGTTRIIGSWTPEGTAEFAKGDVMQVAFLHADAAPALPATNRALADLMTRHGPKITPGPPPKVKPAPSPKVPAGMELRRFKVPPDFLTSASAPPLPAAPVDPFAPAPPAPAPAKEGEIPRRPSAQEVLISNGISFPEGAAATFDELASELVVVNTPESLEMIESLVEELGRRIAMMISQTLHIVQADGPLLRQLVEEAGTVADHGPVWERVEALAAQGRAKVLRVARLDTRSGQRALIEAGTIRMDVGDFAFGAPKPGKEEKAAEPKDEAKPDAEKAEAKPEKKPEDKQAAPAAEPPVDWRFMHLTHETRCAGTRFEVDPVIGPDGITVDLNLALEHHYAPPSEPPALPAANDQTFRIAVPATEYHCASTVTAITLTKGMTKLLAIWRPEGTGKFDGKDVMQAAFLRVELPSWERK
jgi:hypothetical protein